MATWKNPENINKDTRRKCSNRAPPNPPQTQLTEITPYKCLRAKVTLVLSVSSNSMAFEKHHQHTIAICWASRRSSFGPLSCWWCSWPQQGWLQPQSPLFLGAPCSHSAHLSAGRCLWAQGKGEKLLRVLTEGLSKGALACSHVILMSTRISWSSGLLKHSSLISVPGVGHDVMHFQQVPR